MKYCRCYPSLIALLCVCVCLCALFYMSEADRCLNASFKYQYYKDGNFILQHHLVIIIK